MSSILKDVKHKIGPSGDYDYFDKDIIDAINMTFSKLNQIGCGPNSGFKVESEDQQWEDYTTNRVLLGFIQTYVFDNVRLIFDPPNSSYVLSSIKDRIEELTFRIQVEVDPEEVNHE